MKLRGFSTLRLPKRSYTFHTVDAKTNQVKVPLLGLPKEEDWVLYAPYEDKTMIRDVLAYELSNKMGRYAPRTRYVEFFLNTDGGPVNMRDYAGVYVLVEKDQAWQGTRQHRQARSGNEDRARDHRRLHHQARSQ